MINIAIDGPSGSGKSTVASGVANKLHICHLNTGELYRTIAVYLYENNIDAFSEKEVGLVINKINIEIKFENNTQYNFLNGVCVNNKLHNPTIDDFSSRSSALPCVREKIKFLQRNYAKSNSVVMEGRDIATEVLPNAKYKFYLTANPEIRAKRRYEEMLKKGLKVDFNDVLKDIELRDYRDTHRKISPLKVDKDAVLINTDNSTVDEVVNLILKKIKGDE